MAYPYQVNLPALQPGERYGLRAAAGPVMPGSVLRNWGSVRLYVVQAVQPLTTAEQRRHATAEMRAYSEYAPVCYELEGADPVRAVARVLYTTAGRLHAGVYTPARRVHAVSAHYVLSRVVGGSPLSVGYRHVQIVAKPVAPSWS